MGSLGLAFGPLSLPAMTQWAALRASQPSKVISATRGSDDPGRHMSKHMRVFREEEPGQPRCFCDNGPKSLPPLAQAFSGLEYIRH